MTDEVPTPLDAAHAAMVARPDEPGPRLRFFERVLDAQLFVLTEEEAAPDRLRPLVRDLEAGRFALAFDRDARLAAFVAAPAAYAALSGRRLVAALDGRGVGLALNPGVAPSSTLLSADEIDWLAGMAASAATKTERARVSAVVQPTVGDDLVTALGPKLASMADTVEAAWLAALRLEDGSERLTLAIAGTPAAAQPGVAAAIAEAVRFSGGDGAGLDVTFLAPGSSARAAFERVGLRFARPAPPDLPPASPRPPGGDPARPPRLR